MSLIHSLFGLDMQIRDQNGCTMSPWSVNLIEYFNIHREIKDIIDRNRQSVMSENHSYSDRNSKLSISSGSQLNGSINMIDNGHVGDKVSEMNSLSVSLVNFICTVKQPIDILMAIYDINEAKFITENYKVKWSAQGLINDLSKLNKIRIVFTVRKLVPVIFSHVFHFTGSRSV